jgi:hypothetical protein
MPTKSFELLIKEQDQTIQEQKETIHLLVTQVKKLQNQLAQFQNGEIINKIVEECKEIDSFVEGERKRPNKRSGWNRTITPVPVEEYTPPPPTIDCPSTPPTSPTECQTVPPPTTGGGEVNFASLKLVDLKKICKDNKWKGYSKLSKPKLIEFINSKQ